MMPAGIHHGFGEGGAGRQRVAAHGLLPWVARAAVTLAVQLVLLSNPANSQAEDGTQVPAPVESSQLTIPAQPKSVSPIVPPEAWNGDSMGIGTGCLIGGIVGSLLGSGVAAAILGDHGPGFERLGHMITGALIGGPVGGLIGALLAARANDGLVARPDERGVSSLARFDSGRVPLLPDEQGL